MVSFDMNSDPKETQATTPPRFNWLLFCGVMLAPPVLTSLTVLLGSKSGDASVAVALFGGAISGIICGVMLGRRLGKTPGLRLLFGLVLALVMIVVCVGMSCFGCLASGFQLNFH